MDDEFPKSLRTVERVFVRFLNVSGKRVEVIWLNFDGIGVPYRELNNKEYVDIDTYHHHYWIVIDCKTRDRMNLFYGPLKYAFCLLKYI